MTTLALTNLRLADTWNMHGGWGWMMPMMLGMALFWGAIILGFVWLVRDGFMRRPDQRDETALTILDRRFAEGALSPTSTTSAGTCWPAVAKQRPDKTQRRCNVKKLLVGTASQTAEHRAPGASRSQPARSRARKVRPHAALLPANRSTGGRIAHEAATRAAPPRRWPATGTGEPMTTTCGPPGSNGRSNVETTVEAENVPRTRAARRRRRSAARAAPSAARARLRASETRPTSSPTRASAVPCTTISSPSALSVCTGSSVAGVELEQHQAAVLAVPVALWRGKLTRRPDPIGASS